MPISAEHEVIFPRTMSSSETPSSEVVEPPEAPEASERSFSDASNSLLPEAFSGNANAPSLSNPASRSNRSSISSRSRARVRRSAPDRPVNFLRRSRNPDLPSAALPANRTNRTNRPEHRPGSKAETVDGFDELGHAPHLERPFIDAVSIAEVEMTASCGFPSPALDYRVDELDVASYFVREPAATYIVTARGDSMVNAGILDGDKLFVDRSLEPRNGDIVLAFYDGSFTVKRLVLKDGRPELHPENSSGKYSVLRPDPETLSIEGVVVSCGRTFRR